MKIFVNHLGFKPGGIMNKYGFNFQWIYTWTEGRKPQPPDLKALDFIADAGFNFIRVASDYRFWTRNFDYQNPDTGVLNYFDEYLKACRERGLHLCINFHRAPGYCINNNSMERDNLWLDKVAQDGFIHQWKLMAERYKGVDSSALSFDLVNEPPEIGEYGLTRENHADLVRRTVKQIRAVDPNREIVIDGLGGGNYAMPELADLDVVQSGRGYQPMSVSHYEAKWWNGNKDLPYPVYPDNRWNGRTWNRDSLREFYKPWLMLVEKGVKVHIGEFGCYDHTPQETALNWFKDILGLFNEFKWGYSLWNFEGSFGIIGHSRPGARFELYRGYNVDRTLLELLQQNMYRQ